MGEQFQYIFNGYDLRYFDCFLCFLNSNIFLNHANWENDPRISIEQAKSNFKEEREYYSKNVYLSPFLTEQLINLYHHQYVIIKNFRFPFKPRDIWQKIQEVVHISKETENKFKPFLRKKSKLYNRNIFHVHHSETLNFEMNQIRYLSNKFRKGNKYAETIQRISKENPNINPYLYFTQVTINESMNWREKTGEWLVFQWTGYELRFLCLWIHDPNDTTDEELFKVIKEYIV